MNVTVMFQPYALDVRSMSAVLVVIGTWRSGLLVQGTYDYSEGRGLKFHFVYSIYVSNPSVTVTLTNLALGMKRLGEGATVRVSGSNSGQP